MSCIYRAVYTNKNILVDEAGEEKINRVLVYSAVEILEYIIQESKSDTFYSIVEYNGSKVSGIILENGYKVLGVFQSSEDERARIKEIATKARSKVLKGEFNRFEF